MKASPSCLQAAYISSTHKGEEQYASCLLGLQAVRTLCVSLTVPHCKATLCCVSQNTLGVSHSTALTFYVLHLSLLSVSLLPRALYQWLSRSPTLPRC